jgi:serine phosphatase RsbU (regulator of sigma subunit)/HD-like signal output (HDOD) protein
METAPKYFMTELVAEVGSLPALAAQIVSLSSDPACELGALSRLILSDGVLSMRFLALANSAAVSHGQEVSNLRGALVRLGMRRVRNVALLMGMHDMTPASTLPTGLDGTAFWEYCLAVASCAHGLAEQRRLVLPDDAWLVGILHGLGVTALAQRLGADLQPVVAHAKAHGTTLAAAEMLLLDFHHGELGARILKEWNLPRVFAEAVEFHVEDFQEGEVDEAAGRLIGVLRGAIAMARSIGFGEGGDGTPVSPLLELAAELGLEYLALEALAVRVDQEVREMSCLIGLQPPGDLFADALRASQAEVARLGLAGLDSSLANDEFAEEMSAAREIQQRILPPGLPCIAGWEFAAVNHPSRSVSGDTYDFLTLADGSPGVLIADVAGKGMPAALLASTLQASIRALALIHADPGELLVAANRAVYDCTDAEGFATVFLAVMAPASGELCYASAGHNPPLLRRACGRQEWLKPAGAPLGMHPQMKYPVFRVRLDPGDVLVTYTDGITEARNRRGEEFGGHGLLEVVVAEAHNPPEIITTQVVAAVERHLARSPGPSDRLAETRRVKMAESGPADDLTIVVLKKV